MVELEGGMEKNEGSGGNTRCSFEIWEPSVVEGKARVQILLNAMSIKLNKRVVLHHRFTRDVQISSLQYLDTI